MMALFRFRHPPLFIPWSQIQITPKKNFFRKGMEFHLGGEQGVSLWIGANLAERLRRRRLGEQRGRAAAPLMAGQTDFQFPAGPQQAALGGGFGNVQALRDIGERKTHGLAQ